MPNASRPQLPTIPYTRPAGPPESVWFTPHLLWGRLYMDAASRAPVECRAMLGEACFRWVGLAAGALVALSASGCTGDPVVRLHVCGDARVPEDLDAVRVSLLDETGQEIFSAVKELFVPEGAADAGAPGPDGGAPPDGGACTPGSAEVLPLVFDLHDGQGRMWVVVEGLKDGVPVVRYDAQADQPVRGVADVYAAFSQDCVGVRCAYGQTCAAGRCEIAVLGGAPEACDGSPYEGGSTDACLPEAAP